MRIDGSGNSGNDKICKLPLTQHLLLKRLYQTLKYNI